MNVDTMRNIDHYIGVPLTFVGTIMHKLYKKIFKKEKRLPKNILLIELSEMGSAILVDPAMRKLKDNIKGEVFFVIFEKNKPSLKLLNTIKDENIFTISEKSLIDIATTTIKFISWCRNKQIDSVIDLELFSRFTALLSVSSGADNIVGFHSFYNEGLYRGDFLTKKVSYNAHQHISKNFIALVDALLSTTTQVPYTKRIIADDEIKIAKATITKEEQENIYDVILTNYNQFNKTQHHIVLVNSNASDLLPQRRWDKQNYAKVIKKILNYDKNILVLLTGSPSENNGVEQLSSLVNDKRCVNFAGKVKFLQLPALYSISSMMLTNDSGPAHFASITNIHTFVIFGPETPALYGSLGSTTPIYSHMSCSPCVSASNHRKTACTDNQCIKIITPDWVFNIMEKYLNELN